MLSRFVFFPMQNLDFPLSTSRLLLRPFADTDLNDIFEYHSSPEVVRYMYWEVRDLEQTREALEKKKTLTSLNGEGDALCLAVELKENHKVIGEVILFWRSQAHQQGEIGYVFHPGFGSKGYATEAARVMLAIGFEQIMFHRIYARCDPRNVPSWRLMERLGMRREAHFVHNEFFKGEWGDEFYYALLRDEWLKSSEREY